MANKENSFVCLEKAFTEGLIRASFWIPGRPRAGASLDRQIRGLSGRKARNLRVASFRCLIRGPLRQTVYPLSPRPREEHVHFIMSRRHHIERYLYNLAVRYPRLGIWCADLVHRVQYGLNRGGVKRNLSSRSDWRKLLGRNAPIKVSAIRYQQSRNRFREELLERILKKAEPRHARRLAEWKHIERLRRPLEEGRPVIIALWHMGPVFACPLGLLDLDCPLTILLYNPITGILPENWELVFTAEADSSRVQAFKKCRGQLKAGRPVVIACDVFTREESSLPAKVFNMELSMKRGFAALARSSGAMIIPVSIEWKGRNRLIFEAHLPLKSTEGNRSDREGFEAAVVREFGERSDAFMRAHPYGLHPRRVDMFVNAWNRLHGSGGHAKDIVKNRFAIEEDAPAQKRIESR